MPDPIQRPHRPRLPNASSEGVGHKAQTPLPRDRWVRARSTRKLLTPRILPGSAVTAMDASVWNARLHAKLFPRFLCLPFSGSLRSHFPGPTVSFPGSCCRYQVRCAHAFPGSQCSRFPGLPPIGSTAPVVAIRFTSLALSMGYALLWLAALALSMGYALRCSLRSRFLRAAPFQARCARAFNGLRPSLLASLALFPGCALSGSLRSLFLSQTLLCVPLPPGL